MHGASEAHAAGHAIGLAEQDTLCIAGPFVRELSHTHAARVEADGKPDEEACWKLKTVPGCFVFAGGGGE